MSITTSTWLGSGVLWTDPANWVGGQVPDGAGAALFDGTGAYPALIDSGATVSFGTVALEQLLVTAASASLSLQPHTIVQVGNDADGEFHNAGTIMVPANTLLRINADGASALPYGAFVNSGVLVVDPAAGAVVNADVATGQLGSIQGGGTVFLYGTLDNTGATLSLATAPVALTGTVLGGTIDTGSLTLSLSGRPGHATTPVSLQGVIVLGTASIQSGTVAFDAGSALLPGAGQSRFTLDIRVNSTANFATGGTIDDIDVRVIETGASLLAPLATLGAGSLVEVGGASGFLTIAVGANAGTMSSARTLHATMDGNSGTIALDGAGAIGLLGIAANTGTIAAANGATLHLQAAVSGTGTIAAASGASITLDDAYGAQSFAFAGTGGSISLAAVGGTVDVYGFAPGATLDLQGATSIVLAGGTLTASQGAVALGAFVMHGLPGNATLDLAVSGGHGFVTETIACFVQGTRIATPGGSVAVENLRPGDRVLSAFGGSALIIWIGHRRLDCRRHPRPLEVLPVRIAAHAFAPGRPCRDLLLSPDHAVLVDGVLIPVRHLVNGCTIARQHAASVTYFHVELPAHDALVAEGLACESYLDTGNRSAFAGGGATMLHPRFAPASWEVDACAPLVLSGPALARIHRRLRDRAVALGDRCTDDPGLVIAGGSEAIAPAPSGTGSYEVCFAGAVDGIVIRSRCWVPSEASPDQADTRRLGVAIRALRLDGIPVALDDARLSAGWHDPEPGLRWTGGAAAIACDGVRRVTVTLARIGSYWAGMPGPALVAQRPR